MLFSSIIIIINNLFIIKSNNIYYKNNGQIQELKAMLTIILMFPRLIFTSSATKSLHKLSYLSFAHIQFLQQYG